MNEVDFYKQLTNKWPILHWVRIESTTTNGIPDTNFCYDGVEGFAEFKLLRGKHIYLEKFQAQFHLLRNKKGGRCLIICRDDTTIHVLRLSNPRTLEFADDIGKFRKIAIEHLDSVIKWTKPFDWPKMFEEFMESIR